MSLNQSMLLLGWTSSRLWIWWVFQAYWLKILLIFFLPGWEEPASDHLHVVQSGEKFAFKKEQGEKHWSYLGLSITKTVLTKPLIIQAWKDYQMTWNSSEFGGVESVVIHPKYLWTPDILLYNRWQSITYMIKIIEIKIIYQILQRWRTFWRDVPNKHCCFKRRIHALCSAWHLQINLQGGWSIDDHHDIC